MKPLDDTFTHQGCYDDGSFLDFLFVRYLTIGWKPERSIGVCADLIIEIEQRMELLVLQDRGKKILQKAKHQQTLHHPHLDFSILLTSSFCFASVKQWMSSRLSSTNPTCPIKLN